MQPRPWIIIATAIRPRGLRGEFWCSGVVEGVEFKVGQELRLGCWVEERPSGRLSWQHLAGLSDERYHAWVEGCRSYVLEHWQQRSSGMVMRCKNLRQREQVEELRGWAVLARRCDLSAGTALYCSDLYLKDALDPQGQLWAQVVDVRSYGAADILVLRSPRGEEWHIPYVVGVYFAAASSQKPLRCLRQREDLEDFLQARCVVPTRLP